MPGLYYLVLQNGYSEEKNTWKPLLAVIHLCKFINAFYKERLEKLSATFLHLNSVASMVRPTVLKEQQPKQWCGCLVKRANKKGRNQNVVLKTAVPFIAPDLDIVPLSKELVSISNQHLVFFPVFQLGFGSFSPPAKQQ